MGGCFSSTSKRPATPAVSRDPPLPEPDAEETVKEVLSETPRPSRPRPRPANSDLAAGRKEARILDKPLPVPGIVPLPIDDARSEDASEAWSVSAKSETLLVATSATPAEKRCRAVAPEAERRTRREERSPAKHQRKRSLSGELGSRRDRSVSVGCVSGRSSPSPGARRPDPTSVGRTNSVRDPTRSRGNVSAAKRDPGERSGRRSVSPAAKRLAELRQSGEQCRVPPPLLPPAFSAKAKGPKQEFRVDEGERKACAGGEPATAAAAGDIVAGNEGEAKDSLDNPLVSLECFIFL
ncbi:uncharacterized protein LOC141816454 [Curcuma longa]|uniref:uncharacterized protein LOC141816454 n=1 Tax=Curcuma longa TaxID=136217 RepID=UPI003D9EFFE1